MYVSHHHYISCVIATTLTYSLYSKKRINLATMAKLSTTPCAATMMFFIIITTVPNAAAIDSEAVVKAFRSFEFSGSVLTQDTKQFDKFRKVENGACNGIIPFLIVRPRNTKDVAVAVKVSRMFDLPISVRSGGHSYTCMEYVQQ